MINTIKEELLNYFADSYFNAEWIKVDGQGNFNKLIKENSYKISYFSLGNLRNINKNFLLCQIKSLSGNRSDGFGQLGTANFGTTLTLNIYIEKEVKPSDCAMVSDMYIKILYDCIQKFCYEYRGNITQVDPSVSINKYYASSNNSQINFNSIDKLIIDCDYSFTCKNQNLDLEV